MQSRIMDKLQGTNLGIREWLIISSIDSLSVACINSTSRGYVPEKGSTDNGHSKVPVMI